MGRSKLPHVLRFFRDLTADEAPLPGQPSRRAVLAATSVGALYLPRFDAQLAKFETLPPGLKDDKQPFAKELDAADGLHDGLGASIFFYCESVARSPRSTPEQRQAAERVRVAFVPTLASLTIDYEREGDLHRDTKQALSDLAVDLDRFPVPTSAGESGTVTLRAVAAAFVDSKAEINKWISARAAKHAEKVTDADRSRAAHLLSEAVGLINRCRASLRDGFDDAKAAAAADAAIFGLLDQSASHGDGGTANINAPAEPGPGPEVPVPAGSPSEHDATPA